MKVKRVRKKILEISQAHSLLRDKVAALSLRSNTDDEIQRIVRQSFAGSYQCQYYYCSNNESQKPQEDRNNVLDSEFSKSLELPTFPKFKNSETQASPTASKVVSIKTRQAAIKQQGEETSILNRIETVTTCPIIIHRRNNQANVKDIADPTSHRVKSRKTRPVSMVSSAFVHIIMTQAVTLIKRTSQITTATCVNPGRMQGKTDDITHKRK
jgi:hypothetical protein